MTDTPAALTCDGRHPLIRHDGSMIYLYDLVAHPNCPHQPWADHRDTPEPVVPAEAIEALEHVGRSWLDIELAMASTPSPFHKQSRAVVSPGCYEASWGWVHVRPSCRCPR